MNIYLYYRTYWGDPKSVGMSGRNILAKTTVTIPAHCIPSFKPAKEFVDAVKEKV